MNLIPVISIAAIVIGIAGVIPHIWTMARSRQASGQSPVAWGMGVSTNAMMGYVNFAGYKAELLGAGNLAGGLLCALALALVMRLQGRRPAWRRAR